MSRAVAAALVAASAAVDVALAAEEQEPNYPAMYAQPLPIADGGAAEVTGALGATALGAPLVNDVDLYAFEGSEGDVVTIDIDGGMKTTDERSVDTVLAVFGADLRKLRENDDPSTLDVGSTSLADARIDNFRLPATGVYVVGVSSYPRFFLDGAVLTSSTLNSRSNGSYILRITGVTSPLQHINILIKPGSGELAPVNPKSRGKIPVALLSSAEFDALAVDRSSITFGATGDERSLVRCGKEGEDVNGDGLLDLVCHFDNQSAGFEPGNLEGVVKGMAGRRFEGRGLLKVVPGKRRH